MRIAASLLVLLAGCRGPGTEEKEDPVIAEVNQQAITDEELLLQEAERLGLDRSPKLDRILQEEERVLTLRALYHYAGTKNPQPSEEELRAYFATSPYNRQVRFSLLMVKTPEQIPPLLERLKAGEDFETLSIKYSQDSHILMRQADMGYHRWGETHPSHAALTRKAFALKPGEIAGPLKVADGYFLIKLTDIHPVSFERKRKTIEQLVMQERLRPQLAEYYARLQQRYDLRFDEQGLQALMKEMGSLPAVEKTGAHTGHQDHQGHIVPQDHSLPGEQSVSAEDPSKPVLTYKDGVLTLDQVLQGLKESDRGMPRDLEALRWKLLRQVLIPKEIERADLGHAESVREGLERARRKFLIRRLQARIVSQVPKPNVDVLRLYFEENKARYLQPAQVEVRRMLVQDRLTGQKIVEELKTGQDTLALVDRFVSLTYGRAALQSNSPISTALKAEEGSILGPFKTDNGFVILQVLRRYPSRMPSLEEIQDQVTADFLRDEGNSLFQNFLKDLRNRYAGQIKIHHERVQKLELLSSKG